MKLLLFAHTFIGLLRKSSSSHNQSEQLCNQSLSLDTLITDAAIFDRRSATTASNGKSTESIHVVMQVTEEIKEYGRLSIATNALWAHSHGYSMTVYGAFHSGRPVPKGYDLRFGKVDILRRETRKAAATVITSEGDVHLHEGAEWLLWLDADTFSTMRSNWVEDIITKYGSTAHVIASIDGGEDGTINTGVLLMRRSSWAAQLCETWWTHPSAKAGRTDQSVLDEVLAGLRESGDSIRFAPKSSHEEDALPLDAKVVVLQADAMNCDQKWWRTFRPGISPILHLMNHPTHVREIIGSAILERFWCSPVTEGSALVLTWLIPRYEESLRMCAFDIYEERCVEILLNYYLDMQRVDKAKGVWLFGINSGMLDSDKMKRSGLGFYDLQTYHRAVDGNLYINLKPFVISSEDRLKIVRRAHATGRMTTEGLVTLYKCALAALKRESAAASILSKTHGTIATLLHKEGVANNEEVEKNFDFAIDFDPSNWKIKSNFAQFLFVSGAPLKIERGFSLLSDAIILAESVDPAAAKLLQRQKKAISSQLRFTNSIQRSS